MPRVLAYTPGWLSRGAPGFEFFAASEQEVQHDSGPSLKSTLPQKTVAHRGTEVYVAVGQTIRWGELVNIKEIGEARGAQNGSREAEQSAAFKTLDIRKAGGDIKQLVLSPDGDYLAVVRSHTIHIVQLPSPRHLEDDGEKVKPKRVVQLGPLAHVYNESPIACVLWHPMGVQGQCLVTITQSALVRLWEIDFHSKQSFEQPTVELDLTALADATSGSEDLQGSGFNRNKYFSAYSPEFEPVAAAFGGSDASGESPWSAMTLWIAMKEGDIYALCPLLPKRWQASERLVDAALLIANAEEHENTQEGSSLLEWGRSLANQEPLKWLSSAPFARNSPKSIYSRPSKPESAPVLQGPFVVSPEMKEWDPEISDITIMDVGTNPAESTSAFDDVDFNCEDDEDLFSGISGAMVCLLTTAGTVAITLCLEGVEPQWLSTPSRTNPQTNGASSDMKPMDDTRTDRPLLLVQSFSVAQTQVPSSTIRPSFTRDGFSPFASFISYGQTVAFFSISSFINNLREEFETTTGSSFRISTLLENSQPHVETVLTIPSPSSHSPSPMSSSIVIRDADLGYLLLTTFNGEPFAAELDVRSAPQATGSRATESLIKQEEFDEDGKIDGLLATSFRTLSFAAQREPYRPDRAFYTESNDLLNVKQSQHPLQLQKQVRLSNETLGFVTQCHRLLSEETEEVSRAAADLFRRCEILLKDFRDQIARVGEVRDKVDGLADSDADWEGDEDEAPSDLGAGNLSHRIDQVIARQNELVRRRTALLGKVSRVQNGLGELSDKEKAWKNDIMAIASNFPDDDAALHTDGDKNQTVASSTELHSRLAAIRTVKTELLGDADKVASETAAKLKQNAGADDAAAFSSPRAASKFKRQREQQVVDLLERETALIEGVMERVGRLAGRA